MSDVNAIADLDIKSAIGSKDQKVHQNASNLGIEIAKIEKLYSGLDSVPERPRFEVPADSDGRSVFMRQQQEMIRSLRDRIALGRGMQREKILPALLVELRGRVAAFHEAYSKEVPQPFSFFGLPAFSVAKPRNAK